VIRVDIHTVGDALSHARRIIGAGDTPLTPTTAHAILAYVVGRGRAWLLAHPEAPLDAESAARFSNLIDRAAGGEPLAHLVGQREFYGLSFAITPDVLIPRPETEAVVDVMLAWLDTHGCPTPRLADVGTGSGAIAVTLAVKRPDARVTATDISAPALEVARCNAERHAVADRVDFVLADLLAPFAGPFDAVAANLPYINRDELAALEVGRWEPRVALDGGPNGLDHVRRLLAELPTRLASPGLLVLEIGHDQGPRAVRLCADAFPAARVALRPDLAGLDRIVSVETP
jgi:release factor glutamine methyltransferase